MIHWTTADAQMLAHVTDVMNERIAVEGGYEEESKDTMVKLEALSKAGAALTVPLTGDESGKGDTWRSIVEAELDHWVPNASQRLLFRAGRALGFDQPDPLFGGKDCGPDRPSHALFTEWVGGAYLNRCATCFRLFRA